MIHYYHFQVHYGFEAAASRVKYVNTLEEAEAFVARLVNPRCWFIRQIEEVGHSFLVKQMEKPVVQTPMKRVYQVVFCGPSTVIETFRTWADANGFLDLYARMNGLENHSFAIRCVFVPAD